MNGPVSHIKSGREIDRGKSLLHKQTKQCNEGKWNLLGSPEMIPKPL